MLKFIAGCVCGFLALLLWALYQGRMPRALPKAPVATMVAPALPVDGEWLVFWGGPTAAQNAHHGFGAQHHALDLVKVGADGRTHTGTGTSNPDYHCWGAGIRAIAPGRVVVAVSGIPDNEPGQMNADMIYGNLVIVDHGEGRHSLSAHLMNGPLAVAVGDDVAAGQVLGRCGNSGNSSEPHLHLQVQSSPALGTGEPLELRFARVRVQGAIRADHSPVKGERVAPAE